MYHILLTIFLIQATYLDLYSEGHKLLEDKKAKEAEVALKKSVSLNPTYAPAIKELAEAYVALNRFNDAIEQYQKVIELNPNDIDSRGHLSELYAWAGNHDKSIVAYKDALELAPNNLNLKTGLARVLRWSHRHDEAERLYKEALQADPENHEALKGLAKTYSMRGDLAAAAGIFSKAVKLFPNDAELHKELGTVLAWQKDYKGAVDLLKKAVELSPNYADAHRTMGDVYSWMKSYKQAIDSYKKAIDIEPNNIENHISVARIYKQMEKDQMAEEALKAALKINPSDTRALELLREIRLEGKHPLIKGAGDVIELGGFLIVFVVIFIISRSRKRMLKRRHKAYLYFVNFILPALVIFTFASYIWKDFFSRWIDVHVIAEFNEAFIFIALGVSFFATLWNEYRSKEFSNMVILAVGAHPDDIELGCGGFIMKAKDSGAAVYGLIMTRGEKGALEDDKRKGEFRQAARFMELDGFWMNELPDTKLQDFITQMKDTIEEKIKEVGANTVLTHTPLDIHTDHQAVFEATKVAARKISIICYEDVSTSREFVPNYFVDITGYIEDKMRLIAFHSTQEAKAYMDPEVVKGRAAHRGIQSGVQYAEAFRTHKLLR